MAENQVLKRRVLIKAEVARHLRRAPKDNARFSVTNLKGSLRHPYKVYCDRGQVENRIKELHRGLEIDRMSCTSFLANQLRVLNSAAAYVLMQELRLLARRGSCARAQVDTRHERLIKLGVWIERSVQRFVLHRPDSLPYFKTGCASRALLAPLSGLSHRLNCWHKDTLMHIERFRGNPLNVFCAAACRSTRSRSQIQRTLAAFMNSAG